MENKKKINVFDKERVFCKIQRDGNACKYDYKKQKDESICQRLVYEGYLKFEERNEDYCVVRLTEKGLTAKKSFGYIVYRFGLMALATIAIGLISLLI